MQLVVPGRGQNSTLPNSVLLFEWPQRAVSLLDAWRGEEHARGFPGMWCVSPVDEPSAESLGHNHQYICFSCNSCSLQCAHSVAALHLMFTLCSVSRTQYRVW